MESKLLTIAIATYNMENYLSECVQSLLLPEIMNEIEILIVNDGSTDASSRIAHEYETAYPAVIRVIDKENGGYGTAVNAAIDVATGKYFKTLDADDWFEKEAFKEFVEKLRTIDSDLVVTNFSGEYIHSGYSNIITHYGEGLEYGTVYDFTTFYFAERINRGEIEMHAMGYKTDVLRQGNFRMSGCYYSDTEYCFYPLEYVKTIVFLDILLYRYRIGREGQSVSEQGVLKYFDNHNYITKKFLDHFNGHYLYSDSTLSYNMLNKVMRLLSANIELMYKVVYHHDPERGKKLVLDFENHLLTLDEDLQIIGKRYFYMWGKGFDR